MEPYVIKKDGKYEGFCIDIMDALAQRLNFRYEVIESPNNVYGNCMEFNNGTVSCDGMVKMLVDQVRNIFSIFFEVWRLFTSKCSANPSPSFLIDTNYVYLHIQNYL